MMETKPISREDLFREISGLAEDEGTADKEMWDELIDEVVDGHLDSGELGVEQNTEEMKEVLRERWEEYKGSLSS
jgi:hypothetical protein